MNQHITLALSSILMRTYLFLLRGINVGGKNILPMRDLTSLLEANGYQNVKTYIQSGNVVLSGSKKPGEIISKAIESKFGFKPETMVLERSEFEKAIESNPFGPDEAKSIHIFFLSEVPKSPNIGKLVTLSSATEKYELNGKVFYLYAPDGIGRSRLVANLEKCMGVSATGRNFNTISKLMKIIKNA